MLKLITTVLIIVTAKFSFAQEVPAFVKKVYDDIYSTMDNGQVVKPKITVSIDVKEVASFVPSSNEVRIGVELIKLARSFGKDSSIVIAHVLGHELSHVLLQQNDFVKKIGSGYASESYNQNLKKLHQTLQDSVFERQADEFSALYAYMSGYKTINLAPIVLDSIYQHFQLKDKSLSRYPTLSERKLIASTTGERMKVLATVFDNANLSLIAGKYDVAIVLYNTIIKEKFPSREIYNNLGVLHLSKALSGLDKTEFPYVFPCEIDLKTRLKDSQERGLSSDSETELIEAIRNFELALKNKTYYTAWFNKAITELLLNRSEDFQISLMMAKRADSSELKEKIALLSMIFEHKFGDKKEAEKQIKKLGETNIIAQLNYSILTDENFLLNESRTGIIYPEKWLTDLVKNENSLPNFDFFSTEAKSTDALKKVARYEKSLSMYFLQNEAFGCTKLYYKEGEPKLSLKLYQLKNIPTLTNIKIEELAAIADAFYSLNRISFLKFNSLILEFENGKLLNCYYIN